MLIAAMIVIFALMRWRFGGHDWLVLALQPKFQVIRVNPDGTMIVRRMNEEYLVRCEDNCGDFSAGKRYSMLDRGGALELRRGGRTILLPVIQQHVEFDTVTGGRG